MRNYFLFWLLILGIGLSNCELSDKKVSLDSGNNQIEDAKSIEESEIVEVNEPANWITDSKKDIKYLHITWTKEPATTLTIQWQSSYINTEKYKPVVWIVKARDVKIESGKISMPYAKQFVFSGKGFVYTTEDINGYKEKRAQYIVEVFNLEEDTEYYYRVGTFDDFDFEKRSFVNPNLSEAYKIKTGLRVGNKKPFSVFVGGDSQSGINKIKNNIDYIKGIKSDFWLFYGDLVEVGTQPEWDAYFDAMQPLLTTKVFMPVQGNHETISELFYYQFELPVNPNLPEEFKEHHWSFDYGVAHFVGLNSLTDATVKAANSFLEEDLKSTRENPNIRWIIVMFHHPAYSACTTHGSTQRVIDNWVPIFEKYAVNLVLSGHDHNYERTYPIKNNQKVPPSEGVQYVVCSPFMSPKWYSAGNDWWTYKSRDGSDGAYGIIEIDDSTLTFTAYTNDGVDVIDTFTIKKD